MLPKSSRVQFGITSVGRAFTVRGGNCVHRKQDAALCAPRRHLSAKKHRPGPLLAFLKVITVRDGDTGKNDFLPDSMAWACDKRKKKYLLIAHRFILNQIQPVLKGKIF